MVEIEIDGQKLEAPQGAMIIEVADAHNIQIPRFCYHKKLSVAANCRMCLVEVEKMPKTVPACATPVTPGMKIFTQSPKTKDSQRAVMEFLLINHPLDCPICDQGGECELQDNALEYGLDRSPYEETKRVIQDEDIGPLVATDLTRCIQCSRCVRFGQEVAGMRELGLTQRGEESEIRTFVKHSLASEISANIIDLCPVGALTSKPFRFTARAWELDQHEGIAPHDALGSNIYLHTRNHTLMRVIPKEQESLNETWLSDRDRFSYLGLKSKNRLLSPMIKRAEEWHAVDWETALHFAAEKIQAIAQKESAPSLFALSSPSATQEEYYLLAKLWKALGSDHSTFYLRTLDLSDGLTTPHFGLSLAEIEQQKSIFIIGAEINKEIPLLGVRFRKAAVAGATIDTLNPCDFNFNVNGHTKITAFQLVPELAAIVKVLLENLPDHPLQQYDFIKAAHPTNQHKTIANHLMQKGKSFIYLGALAYHAPQAGLLRLLVQTLASLTQATWGMHTDGANTKGLAQVQSILGLPTQTAQELFSGASPQLVLLHNIEPDYDCAHPGQLLKTLPQAECVIALTPFKSPTLLQTADVLLPISSLGETSGTFVNLLGTAQPFKGCVPPQGESKPAWKVFRVLANVLGCSDFTYASTQDIQQEIQQMPMPTAPSLEVAQRLLNAARPMEPQALKTNEFYCITQWPLYRSDNLVRQSEALQQCGSATLPFIYLNENMLNQLQCQVNDQLGVMASEKITLPVMLNPYLPDQVALIPAGFPETTTISEGFGKITLIKA